MRVYYAEKQTFWTNEHVRVQFDPSQQHKGTVCIDTILDPGIYDIGSVRLEIKSAGKNYGVGIVQKTGVVREGDAVSRMPSIEDKL